MSSNFSKNLTCSMGISLGGLELATDFLFTNPEFYESELAEVKNSTFGQNVTKHSYEKPVRPKKTKEAIMHKFSLIHSNTGIQEDEIIESPVIVGEDTEFEFDFDFMQGTTEDNKIEIAEEPDTEIDDRVLEANSIMQRIANMNNVNESLIENGYEEDIDIEEDEEGDINIEEEGDINIEEEDNINIEGDEEGDIDIEEGIGIDEINIEEDDINIEEEEDEISIDEDDDEISIEEQHIIDDFENNFTPSTISNETTENENMSSKFNEDEVGFGENNIDEVSDLDIELDEDDIELDEDDIELDEDDIELDEDEDDIELDEDEDEVSLSSAEESIEKQSSEQVLKHTEKANTENIDKNTSESEELEQMKKRFAEMEKQLQELKSIKAKDKASNIKDNINKINNEDNILGAYKDKKTVENTNKHEQYSLMSIDALYNEVKDYMVEMGVKTRAIEVKALNEKFGELNIRKLIQKSYLIKIGSKGVTIGR